MTKQFKDLSPASQAIVVTHFAKAHGYQTTIPDPAFVPGPIPFLPPQIPNPETRVQFLIRKMNEFPVEAATRQRATDLNAAANIVPTDADL
jgi:hypothetical protein